MVIAPRAHFEGGWGGQDGSRVRSESGVLVEIQLHNLASRRVENKFKRNRMSDMGRRLRETVEPNMVPAKGWEQREFQPIPDPSSTTAKNKRFYADHRGTPRVWWGHININSWCEFKSCWSRNLRNGRGAREDHWYACLFFGQFWFYFSLEVMAQVTACHQRKWDIGPKGTIRACCSTQILLHQPVVPRPTNQTHPWRTQATKITKTRPTPVHVGLTFLVHIPNDSLSSLLVSVSSVSSRQTGWNIKQPLSEAGPTWEPQDKAQGPPRLISSFWDFYGLFHCSLILVDVQHVK